MTRHHVLLTACALLFLGLLSACGDDYGESCDMPDTPAFEAACAADPEAGLEATCIFTNSAQCSSRICARFEGSTDFCSQECDVDADDCPSGSICHLPAGGRTAFCVPPAIVDSVTVSE